LIDRDQELYWRWEIAQRLEKRKVTFGWAIIWLVGSWMWQISICDGVRFLFLEWAGFLIS
jgi:hypothetical protein